MNNKTQIELIFLSFKDLLSSPMLKVAFIPFLTTLFIVYFSFFSVANTALNNLQNTTLEIKTHQTQINNGITSTSNTDATYIGSNIINWLLKYSFTSWIVSFLVYTIGSFMVLLVSLFISLVIVGFLTPIILEYLRKQYYPNITFYGYGTILNSIMMLIKSFLMMVLFLIILIPLYFIPVVNIIAFNFPFFYFFHKMLHFDVGSTLFSKEKYFYYSFKYSTSSRLQTLFLYFISMIPFVALVLPVFYIIYLGHNYMSKFDTFNHEFKNTKTIT
jgi:hypothetical protein